MHWILWGLCLGEYLMPIKEFCDLDSLLRSSKFAKVQHKILQNLIQDKKEIQGIMLALRKCD